MAVEYYKTGPIWDIGVEDWANYEAAGVVSANSGKTTPACVEIARAVLNADPHGKYPMQGVCYIVGKDHKHHGLTIYPKLFKPGAFKIVRDRLTGQWRSFRPDLEPEREVEAVKAPPLIPKRAVKKITWKVKSEQIPSKVELRNGWVIWFFSGEAKPAQGAVADLILLDEEIPDDSWFKEMNLRVVDVNGRIVWSATPQNSTQIFFDLSLMAAEQAEDEHPVVQEFTARMRDNPHLSERAKAEAISSMSPEERLVRDDGEFVLGGMRVYPEYRLSVHGLPAFDVPDTWTRYMVTDPGYQVCAVLFAAVPDPQDVPPHEYEILLYDELYLPACSAERFADAVRPKVEGRRFHEFVIDTQGSQVHQAGSGQTIYQQYSAALARLNIKSEKTGSAFSWGSPDLKSGIEMVRRKLSTFGGPPKIRALAHKRDSGILLPKLENFHWEMERYRRKRVGDILTDDTDERGRVHLCACLRYLVMAQPRYVRPKAAGLDPDPVYLMYLQDRKRERRGNVTYFGPAGSAA